MNKRLIKIHYNYKALWCFENNNELSHLKDFRNKYNQRKRRFSHIHFSLYNYQTIVKLFKIQY